MERRREINDRLVEWISDRAVSEFAGEISLVVIYGSHVNGTGNRLSDVDCYYVPKTERAARAGVAFILDGVGYDIFPVSWERLEGIADLQESLVPLVGDGRIIYSAGTEDVERFRDLQARLEKYLENGEYTREIARRRCEFAAWLMAKLEKAEKASDIRLYTGWVMMFLAEAAAIYNHDYFHCGLKRQAEDLRERYPEIYDDYMRAALAEDAEKAREWAKKMFENVCRHLGMEISVPGDAGGEETQPGNVNAGWLAELYEEIVSTFNKIYINVEAGNISLAYISAVCLQHELIEAREAGCPEYDLLGSYDPQNPVSLADKARETEADFVRFIEENGGVIKRYADFDDFVRADIWKLP